MMKIFLDVDGVLADFVKGTAKLYNHSVDIATTYDYWHALGLTTDQFWDGITATEGKFWRTLPVYPWANKLKRLCEDLAVTTLLTSPPKGVKHKNTMISGRVDWIHDNFGNDFTGYYVGMAKERLAGPNCLLIDDHQDNCEKWVAAGGHAFLFPQPYNSNADKTDDFKFVQKSIMELAGYLDRTAHGPGRII